MVWINPEVVFFWHFIGFLITGIIITIIVIKYSNYLKKREKQRIDEKIKKILNNRGK